MRDGFISEDRSNDGAQVSDTQKVRRLVCDGAEKKLKLVTQKRPKWAVDNGPVTPAFATGLSNRILNRRKRLSLTKLVDANVSCPSAGVVSSTKFDKTGRLLLTGGSDGHARIFVREHSDPSYSMLGSFHNMNAPVQKVDFLPSGSNKILMASARGLFQLNIETNVIDRLAMFRTAESWDAGSFVLGERDSRTMVCVLGRQGRVGIADLQSRCKVATLNSNGHVKGAVFSSDGKDLVTVNSQGTINIWDLRMHRCKQQLFSNEVTNAVTVALSRNNDLLAVGTTNGTAAYYTRWQGDTTETSITPFINTSLNTGIDCMHFSHDGKMLLISSSKTKDALRIIDTSTGYTISNWPTSTTPLGYVFSSDFNRESTELVVGNARGRALLFAVTS
mmetsp:Transcript_8448/g.28231  ORF Transcript_8448/g.28231 Transcript_8448/m.28231 type:complete len:390 (-) Transcript_8448:2618-3787(-)